MTTVQPKLKTMMPPEWEAHRGMLMQWPVTDSVWGEDLSSARHAFARVARAIALYEPLTMIANPSFAGEARRICGETVTVLELEHDDCWVRDNGPTFVRDENGDLAAINWGFNAWGEIYPDYALDNTVPRRLCDLWDIPRIDAPLVLEGGSIHTNGRGIILTTEECLLNPSRNPSLSQSQIEEHLLEYLGAEQVVWLPFGLFGDETSGHIDNICCFLDPSTALLLWTDDPASPDYDRVRKNRSILRQNGFSVEQIIQPPAMAHRGGRLPLSYVNFVFVNGGLILPGFGGAAEQTDRFAKDTLRSLLPSREIVQLPTADIVKGGGNIHCITQQIPL